MDSRQRAERLTVTITQKVVSLPLSGRLGEVDIVDLLGPWNRIEKVAESFFQTLHADAPASSENRERPFRVK